MLEKCYSDPEHFYFVEKTRIKFADGIVIDFYRGDLKKKKFAVLEVELPAYDSPLPALIQNNIENLIEVTNDKSHSNRRIAKEGLPE